jgi:hypothetical protein
MSDPDQPEDQPGPPPSGFALGGLGAGEYDTSLGQPAPAGDDELTVPRDALLAFRKSGGLRFRSRAIVVYRNGWVVPADGAQGKPCHLGEGAMARLTQLVLRSGLARAKPTGAQPPDGHAYEIVARIGGRVRRAEAMDGSIPVDFAALIRALSRLLPSA